MTNEWASTSGDKSRLPLRMLVLAESEEGGSRHPAPATLRATPRGSTRHQNDRRRETEPPSGAPARPTHCPDAAPPTRNSGAGAGGVDRPSRGNLPLIGRTHGPAGRP